MGGGGISRTDCALLEEDARYDNALSSSGMMAIDPLLPHFFLLVGLL